MSEIDEMLSEANIIFPQYASESLKPGQAYRLTSKVYRVGDVGDIFTLLDVCLPEGAVCDGVKRHYVNVSYVTSATGGVQQTVFEKWGSFDHTLMYSMREIIEE